MSKLTKDLNTVAGIVGQLGCNIAEAQKRFDLYYLDSLEKLMVIAKQLATPVAGQPAALPEAVQRTLLTLAPSRYQFTETTLAVRLDLAQSFSLGVSAGLSAGFGAVAVNAALTVGYSFKYEAAAECRAVIHAMPQDRDMFNALLARAGNIGNATPTDLDLTEVDTKIQERLASITKNLPPLAPAQAEAQKPGADADKKPSGGG